MPETFTGADSTLGPKVTSSHRWLIKDSWVLLGLATLSLCAMGAILTQQWIWVSVGANDFVPFYCGARMLDTGQLYDYDAISQEQLRQTGRFEKSYGYIRPPFHAAMLWPLTRLPLVTGYWIFQIASLAALAGFVFLWSPLPKAQTFLFTAISLAALTVFMRGQDDFFLLLLAAVILLLHRKKQPLAAGLLFSLCAVKPHLFVLTPLVLIAHREWRFLKGLLLGGALLTAVSFAVAGLHWPARFIEAASNPLFSPNVAQMPNLNGMLHTLGQGLAWELLLGMTVAVAVWIVSRRADFAYAFPFSFAAGLLVSHHAYMLDMTLLLPAVLTVLAVSRLKSLKLLGVILLTPAAHLAVEVGAPSSAYVTAGLLLFVYLAAYEVWRTQSREGVVWAAGDGNSE